jgi:riboflavin biosynthesis pyrimidine reductase
LPELFDEFVRRKEREAVEADLAPYATVFDARPAGALAIGNAWTRKLFDGDFYVSPPPDAALPACSLVFVQSADGNTGAPNPSTLGGGETDKHLIYEGLSRVAADAVMAGAGTARGGRTIFSVWHPELVRLRAALGKPRHPAQIVATMKGIAVEGELLFNVPGVRVVLLTVPACQALMREALSARPWITTVVVDEEQHLAAAFKRIRALGVETISCIGGRTLATQLLDAGLVQDIYLTTSPRAGGEPRTPIYPKPLDLDLIVQKTGTGVEAGVVFEHARVYVGSG